MTIAIRADAAARRRGRRRFDGIADPVEQALAVLRWAGDTFGDDFAITSSMADGLLAHLASRAIPGVNVIFLDTGYHFAETIGTRDWITTVLPITLRQRAAGRRPSREQDAEFGAAAVRARPRPVLLAAQGAAAGPGAGRLRRLGLGRPPRRVADAAPDTRLVDWDAKRGMVKINPLAAWTQDDVDAYIAEHQIPVNPLLELGYASIGCAPCTRAGRAGRGPARRPLGRPRTRPSAASTA